MMKTEILTLLRESDDFISGQELCGRFGVSRTAVWKAIGRLKKEGYQIEAVQNRGYRLMNSPDAFSEAELVSRLHTEWAGKNLYYYEKTDSTNLRAKQLAEENAPHGTLVVADMQTAGRGRRGRGWESPAKTNVYFTILLRPEDISADVISILTLVMALSVSEAIDETAGTRTDIKWPNDIILHGKKVVGILSEMSAEPEYIHYVVTGVGINVGKQQFSEELVPKATSLEAELGHRVSRAALVEKAMERFEANYEKFRQSGNMGELKESYERRLVNTGREVRVLDLEHEFSGRAVGINDEGELLVRTEDGAVRAVYAGEVSVRGIYGYV